MSYIFGGNTGQSYIFGGNTGQTYEQIQRQREIARAMMQQKGTPKTIGEGISSAANSIAGALMARKADKADAMNREAFGGKWDGVVGALMGRSSGASTPPFSGAPVDAPELRSGLISRGLPEHVADGFLMNFQDESGMDPGINERNPIVPGSEGGFGLSQWTGPRRDALEAFAQQQGKPVSDPNLQLDYLMTELQGPESAAFEKIMGTQDKGSAAAAIATHFLRPAQEHLDRRVAKYTGGQGQSQGAAPSMAQAMQLAELASSPYATPGQKAVAQAMMQRATQANDPLRQLQLQKAQIELQQMQNPQTDPKDRYRVVDGQLVDLTAQGGPTAVDLGGGGGGKDMTESERRIFMFNSMQQQTAPAINMIEDRGFDPSNIQDKLAGGVLAGNFFRSEEGQMYDAAAGAWAESALRLATGAAATPEEYQRIRNMYFAASGDSPETIGFKRSMRESYQNVLRATLEGDMGAEPPTPLTYAIESYYAKQDPAPAPGPAAQPQSEPMSAPQDAGQQNSGLSPEILDALSIAESIGSTEGPSDEQIISAYRAGLNRRDRRRFDAMTPGQQAEEALR
ncbi:phage tail tip lysozyme [Phaeobacter gallaeciensis]|uniref:phage tail tip lysozyme n=1 Tax=Phaeobacter gallaeciensis TaxID=60890 RepID=UPI002380098E|nr:phage tail tip lysozyme [Phaeobacter gallaeciensis]MDE4299662.1 phage tail tip lysozyme [Phaeobacter gallaeciensis]MDE5184827.1 phage tail tip lysozyme [Phaeobacter gallaeciensis]